MVVVDGKYIVEPKRSYDEMLQIVDYLIEQQLRQKETMLTNRVLEN